MLMWSPGGTQLVPGSYSLLIEYTMKGVGIRGLYFHQRGQAGGQGNIQPPDQTCSIHMQNSYTGWGGARSGDWDHGTPLHPY